MNKDTNIKGTRSEETLSHFQCGQCEKWWAIGDAPTTKDTWFCPWCGQEQEIETK